MVNQSRTAIREHLTHALRALRQEILDFSFSCPLEIDNEAGPKDSLHYYLYSDKLSWSVMRMGKDGIPRVHGRLFGEVYKPAYIAWWGLANLAYYLRGHGGQGKDIFLKQVDWLESHACIRDDGSVVWANQYDCLHGRTFLRAPWVSAHDQGLVISALVRGYRMTRRPSLLQLLRGSTHVFERAVEDGGVRIPLPAGALYTEMPGGPVPVILDGFQTSLLALYDLFVETGDARVEELFQDGIVGLANTLERWNYRGKWSWYGARAYLSPPHYHHVNRLQLTVLACLSGHSGLAAYARAWDCERLSRLDRAEIYLAFLLTKNLTRIKCKTWQYNHRKIQRMTARVSETPEVGERVLTGT